VYEIFIAYGISPQAIVNGTIGAAVAIAVTRTWAKPLDTIGILVAGWAAALFLDAPLARATGFDLRICQFLCGAGGMPLCMWVVAFMRNAPKLLSNLTKNGNSNGSGTSG
jgi:ABC-type amino acid transport substrate-binding protein